MSVLGERGDTKIMWDADNAEEVAAAKRTFDDLRKKGFLAFKATGEKGAKGEQIRTFDADAERIILAPPMRGG
jgi:hypothetical protein